MDGVSGDGDDEREQTLNQLLVELDGFDPSENAIVIAGTNRPDTLDPALLRPGRFDRRILVDRPDRAGRHQILEIHAKGKPLAGEIDLDGVAAATPGLTGADLANILNEAALLAVRRRKRLIEPRRRSTTCRKHGSPRNALRPPAQGTAMETCAARVTRLESMCS